jgi:hypothetical protein
MSAKTAIRILLLASTIAAVLPIEAAYANIYQLKNVRLDYAGTASGTFDWDGVLCCANPTLQEWNITVSEGRAYHWIPCVPLHPRYQHIQRLLRQPAAVRCAIRVSRHR